MIRVIISRIFMLLGAGNLVYILYILSTQNNYPLQFYTGEILVSSTLVILAANIQKKINLSNSMTSIYWLILTVSFVFGVYKAEGDFWILTALGLGVFCLRKAILIFYSEKTLTFNETIPFNKVTVDDK